MNLLPTRQRKRVRLLICYQNIVYSGLILILLILFLIFFLGGFLIFLNLKYQNIEKKIMVEQLRVIETRTIKGMERKVSELNEELNKLKQIQSKKTNIYQVLDEISRNLLIGVEVFTLEINRESNKIFISGHSATRDNLLAIKRILESSPDYKNIDFPLSNLTESKDIDFQFSFIYKPLK